MKDQRKGQQFVKKEEMQLFLKEQEFSSHQQEQSQDPSLVLYYLSIQKAVFQQLVFKNQEFIKQIQINQKNLLINTETPQKKYLFEYLSKIQQKEFFLQTQLYNKAMLEFKMLFFEEMTSVWGSMSQEQRAYYNQVGNNNYRMMKKIKEDKVKIDKFNGYQMFEIDVLSLFFLCNKHYLSIFKEHKRSLLSAGFISKIFKMNKGQVSNFMKKCQEVQEFLQFNYQRQFYKYFELLYLIKFAYKLVNYQRRKGKNAFQNIPSVCISLNDIKQVLCTQNIQFRFCQVAFYPISKVFSKQNRESKVLRQFLIKQILQADISNTQRSRKNALLKIYQQQNIPLSFLTMIASQIKQEQAIQANLQFQQKLQKCQWVFMKGSYSLIQGINTALGEKFVNQHSVYWSKERLRILSILCKLAMDRFSLIPTIFKAQEKIEKKDSIFVYKFEYSLRDILNSQKQTNSEQQIPDLRCSLVLLATHNQILTGSVYRNTISYDVYLGLIKLCIKDKIVKYKKEFNLILYQFDYQKSIDWDAFLQFKTFMNKYYGSKVYMLNDPHFYQPHFIVDAFLRSFFIAFSKLNTDNFYILVQVCIHKLLNGVDTFGDKQISDHFAYLQRVMSLPIQFKELWRCFQQKRCNKYEALVLDTEDFKEKKPIAIHLNTKFFVVQDILISIQQCLPIFQKFAHYFYGEKWRSTQLSEEQIENLVKNVQGFLQHKHMKQRDVKRILKDSAKHLLIYQIYFKEILCEQLKNGQQNEISEQMSFLIKFYQTQNENIDSVYPYPQREAIINNLITKSQIGGQKKQVKKKQRQKQINTLVKIQDIQEQ